MRVNGKIEVAAPMELVWSLVTDPERVLSFMSGVTRWEVVSDETNGLGARFLIDRVPQVGERPAVPREQPVEQPPAGPVGQRLEDAVVVGHDTKIGDYIVTCQRLGRRGCMTVTPLPNGS